MKKAVRPDDRTAFVIKKCQAAASSGTAASTTLVVAVMLAADAKVPATTANSTYATLRIMMAARMIATTFTNFLFIFLFVFLSYARPRSASIAALYVSVICFATVAFSAATDV